VDLHPDQDALIRAYFDRWPEMLGGPIPGTAELLGRLRERGVRLFALSNLSTETLADVRRSVPAITMFEDILISGEVKIAKPEPEIFHLAGRRFGIEPRRTFFVDDMPYNVRAARSCDFIALRFTTAAELEHELARLGVP
jgi:2-haloacid dehalogenase